MQLSPRAIQHVVRLQQHYESLDREAAVLNLAAAFYETANIPKRL
jgi:hypothetical protein